MSLRPIDQARLMVPRDFESPLVEDPASLIVLGDYVVSCWGLFGVLLGIAWILCRDCLESCWGLLGVLLGIAWILCRDCLESCWGLLGVLLGIARSLVVVRVVSCWGLPGVLLGIAWISCGDCVGCREAIVALSSCFWRMFS